MTSDVQEIKEPVTSGEVCPETAADTTGLVSHNIRIGNHRTTVRLEPEMWDALHEVAGLENCSIHQLCGAIQDTRKNRLSFTAALRVFLMQYYRAAVLGNPQITLVRSRIKEGTRPFSGSQPSCRRRIT